MLHYNFFQQAQQWQGTATNLSVCASVLLISVKKRRAGGHKGTLHALQRRCKRRGTRAYLDGVVIGSRHHQLLVGREVEGPHRSRVCLQHLALPIAGSMHATPYRTCKLNTPVSKLPPSSADELILVEPPKLLTRVQPHSSLCGIHTIHQNSMIRNLQHSVP